MWKDSVGLLTEYDFNLEKSDNDRFVINYVKKWDNNNFGNKKIVIEIWDNAMYYVNWYRYSSHKDLDIFEQIIKLQKIDLSSIYNIIFPDYLYDEEYKDSNFVKFLTKYSVKFNEESFKRHYDDILSKLSGPY